MAGEAVTTSREPVAANPGPAPAADLQTELTPSATAGASVAVVVIAYESQDTVAPVLEGIPQTVAGSAPVVLVADDCSTDRTHELSQEVAQRRRELDWEVVRRMCNLGYGGNQKECYRWAIETAAEVVVLLHGDGQYDPAQMSDLTTPILEGRADAVLGSRMSTAGGARAGGMPLTRRIGNRALSKLQNALSGESFSEWHSGYRAYATSALRHIDLGSLPDGFDFDTALMYRLLGAGYRYGEVPIPTHYGDEKSRVRLVRFGLQVARRTLMYRLTDHRRRNPLPEAAPVANDFDGSHERIHRDRTQHGHRGAQESRDGHHEDRHEQPDPS